MTVNELKAKLRTSGYDPSITSRGREFPALKLALGGHSNKAGQLLLYTLVPSYFDLYHLALPSFSRDNHLHLSKKERNFMLRNGLAEWLDQKNCVLKRTSDQFEGCNTLKRPNASLSSSRISRSVHGGLRDVMVSEVTRRPMEATA